METANTQQNTSAMSGMLSEFRAHPVLAGVLWFGVFVVLTGLSFALGIVPKLETDEPSVALVEENAPVTQEAQDGTPVRIIAERLDIDVRILNPESADIETLDAALLEGAVRYPGSGDLEDVSNMFLFGHSTGFRVVQNESFKAFNGLKNARTGDLIRVQSATKEYVYRVTDVSLVDAADALVSLSSSEKKLTLTTCNSFGAKEERFVVEAAFVGSYELPQTVGVLTK